MSHRLSICCLPLFFIALLTCGCVSHKQYRDSYKPCIVERADNNCENASLEQHDGYLLGFVEFDDQGWFWNRAQMTAVIDLLQSKEYLESGVIMVVFVHGWKHNASFDDENVQEFRKTLRRIHKTEYLAGKKQNRPPRKVAGIYAGWRGQSVPVPIIDNLTFWDRKNTANTVGHGSLTELLLQLKNVQTSHRSVYEHEKSRLAQTRLIVIGHSFGGQIVHSALSQILLEGFIKDESKPPQVFGDLVVLVNPAFEATRFTPLRENSVTRKWYPQGQLPVMAIFTAKNDDATGVAFPIGRWFSTFFEKHRDGNQKSANRKAIGHFEPFITHDLTLKPGESKEPAQKTPLTPQDREKAELFTAQNDLDAFDSVRQKWLGTSAESGWAFDFGDARLTHLGKTHPLNPLYVVSVDENIIDDHGGIWKMEFIDFLRRFILFSAVAADMNP